MSPYPTFRRTAALAVVALGVAVAGVRTQAQTPAQAPAVYPPPGFTALFNGKDLSGWHGYAIHELRGMTPEKFAAQSLTERTAKIAAWSANADKHWRAENAELVND